MPSERPRKPKSLIWAKVTPAGEGRVCVIADTMLINASYSILRVRELSCWPETMTHAQRRRYG